MDKAATTKYIQSVSRAAAILRCFDGNDELGLTEISKMIGLHKSTTAGLISTLKNEKLLEQNEKTGKLRLGIEIFRLSLNIKMDLRDVCQPYLDELLSTFGETVNLVMRDNDMVMYVEKKESTHSMRICTKIGQRLPLYCTGVGKAILAFLHEDEISDILDNTNFMSFTKNTIIEKDKLLEQAATIRRNGYACDIEELEYGLICVAAPIFNAQMRPIAGISVSGPSMRMKENTLKKIAKCLLETTRSIARYSGGQYVALNTGVKQDLGSTCL